ncbi:MAG: hypothetical protein H0X66_12870 [Verrucomicrobia bacterium]|nr:hypothetical protein [Verrucomicrobiota bacterium]
MKKFHAIFLCSALIQSFVHAQSFSIDWHKIAGGGGTSTGGNYTLTGTIGQHDAGTMSGGNYTLEGGFLSGLVLIQTPGAPTLSIQISGANAVISWAADASVGFSLQESLSLSSPVPWTGSGATITTNGNIKSVTVPANGVRFYRLQKP